MAFELAYLALWLIDTGALGSKLEDWNGMGTAWTYAKDMALDHVAIRTKAG